MFTKDLSPEMIFVMSRSSGKGGQHVNKVSTKVTLVFNIFDSQLLSDEEKEKIKTKLATKITDAGELHIISQKTRSQLKNKEEAIAKFYEIIKKCFIPIKKRKATKPSKGAIAKRLNQKRKRSETKVMRRKRVD